MRVKAQIIDRCLSYLLLACLALVSSCDTMQGEGEDDTGFTETVSLKRIQDWRGEWAVPQDEWRGTWESQTPLPDAVRVRTWAASLELSSNGTYVLTMDLQYATRDWEMLTITQKQSGMVHRSGNLLRFDPEQDPCEEAVVFGLAQASGLMLYLYETRTSERWGHHTMVSRLEFESIVPRAPVDTEPPSDLFHLSTIGHCPGEELPWFAGSYGGSGYNQRHVEAATLSLGEQALVIAEGTESNLGGSVPGATRDFSYSYPADYESSGGLIYFSEPMDSWGFFEGETLIAYELPMMRFDVDARFQVGSP